MTGMEGLAELTVNLLYSAFPECVACSYSRMLVFPNGSSTAAVLLFYSGSDLDQLNLAILFFLYDQNQSFHGRCWHTFSLFVMVLHY